MVLGPGTVGQGGAPESLSRSPGLCRVPLGSSDARDAAVHIVSGFVLERRFICPPGHVPGGSGTHEGMLVTMPIAGVLGIAAYAFLEAFEHGWWLPVGALLTLASVLVAGAAPW